MSKLVFKPLFNNSFRNEDGELCQASQCAADGHVALVRLTHLDWERRTGVPTKAFKIDRALTVKEEKAVEWVRNSEYKRNWRVHFQKTLDDPAYQPENEHVAILRALFAEEKRLANLHSGQEITVEVETTEDMQQDAYGNKFQQVVVEQPNRRISLTVYQLEEGKTTLRCNHTKLADNAHCAYPERLSCNYGIGFGRCEYMKYFDAPGMFLSYGNGTWRCTYGDEKKKVKKGAK